VRGSRKRTLKKRRKKRSRRMRTSTSDELRWTTLSKEQRIFS
jgi:hypothetical protein